jgi:5-methylcytosine-specific restriction endonuclease McrA
MPTRPPLYQPPGWKPTPKRQEVQDPYYQSAEWRQLRQRCLERDRYQCAMPDCTTPNRGSGGRLVADHIVERRAGGADALHNLRTLCSFCDGARHGHRSRRRV